MPNLILRFNGLALKRFDLAQERVTIGRRSDNDIQLDDPAVSGIHAVITLRPDLYLDGAFSVTISDFNSTNGLFVNGRNIAQHRLVAGDVVRIGQHELLFDEPSMNVFDRTVILLRDEGA